MAGDEPNIKKEYFDNFLRDSNVSKYVNIMSNEEVIKELLKPTLDKDLGSKEKKPYIEAISDMLQSITTEAVTVSEMLEALYNTYGIEETDKDIIPYIGNFIKIIHAADYKLNLSASPKTTENTGAGGYWLVNPDNLSMGRKPSVKFSETPFAVQMKSPEPSGKKYIHDDTYGLLGKGKLDKPSLGVYNVEEIAHAKIKVVNDGADVENPINATKNGADSVILARKSNPSMAYILVDEPNLRIGTRNSLELAVFFNSLSTIELSKCQPYFNATFILPSFTTNTKSSFKAYKTASITQFFDGTPIGNSVTTENYRKIESSFERDVSTTRGNKMQDAVVSNLSSFTMPQTVNKFTEKFIGHNSNVEVNTDMNFLRATSVHDITRPFMTIKSFNIDVAPTQGLMSFKTGKLSIVLHDKTRMMDIAPFVKPDLFGSFGAEIAIEYGWSHSDAGEKESFIGKFLNNSRAVEKYIITNSSFSMDNNGQVNIDLSIAMRGPIDMKTVTINSDPSMELKTSAVLSKEHSFREAVSDATLVLAEVHEEFTSKLRSELNAAGNSTASIRKSTMPIANQIITNIGNFKRFNASISAAINAGDIKDIINKIKHKVPGMDRGFIFSDGDGATSVGIANALTDTGDVDVMKEVLEAASKYFSSINTHYISVKTDAEIAEDSLLAKIIGGLNNIDPFYNKAWLNDFRKLLGDNNPREDGITIQGISTTTGPTAYVSLGSFITGLIGTHLACTGKFDEIQIVSYTANENAGLFANKNVSSLLLPRKDLVTFLATIFQNGTTFTIEGIITQVLNRYVSTRTQICYGLSSFYERDAAGNTKPKNEKINIQTKKINDQLRKIYHQQTKDELVPNDHDTGTITLDDVKFAMPKVSFTFDTLTSRKSGYEKTICRISIFDKNNNPFGSINSIMKNVYDKGVITVAAQLNKQRANYKSGLRITNKDLKDSSKSKAEKKKIRSGKQAQKITKEMFFQKSWRLIQNLIDDGKLVELSDGIYEIRDQFKLDTMKSHFKRIMPSLTYGTQNSAIIDATISTVNEAKLNTIYMTRSDRAADNKNLISAKVGFQKDLPLRVLPAQASVTIFGCPFVNFAQYIFLDFETGTTIDNAYAITGIKHDLTPGKFTTQLTLSYGDVYGKYENAAATLARTISDIVKPTPIAKANEASKIRITTYAKSSRTSIGNTRNVYKASESIDVSLPGNDEVSKAQISIETSIRPHKGNYCWIKKIGPGTGDIKGKYELNIIYDIDSAGKNVELDLNLMKDSKHFEDFVNSKTVAGFKKRLTDVIAKPNNYNGSSQFPEKTKLSNGIIIFKDNKNDFITAGKEKAFVNDLIKTFLTIKLHFAFTTPSNTETQVTRVKALEAKLGLDLDSNREALRTLFDKYCNKKELSSFIIHKNYGDYIKNTLNGSFGGTKVRNCIIKNKTTGKIEWYRAFIKTHNKKKLKNYSYTGARPSSKKYRHHLDAKFYLNEQKQPKFTVRGLEFEIASGIASRKRTKKKKDDVVTVDLDYEFIVISYKDIIDHILKVNGFDMATFYKLKPKPNQAYEG